MQSDNRAGGYIINTIYPMMMLEPYSRILRHRARAIGGMIFCQRGSYGLELP